MCNPDCDEADFWSTPWRGIECWCIGVALKWVGECQETLIKRQLFLFVLLSQKHNRYHYAGEHQTQYYYEKKLKGMLVQKTPIVTSQQLLYYPPKQNTKIMSGIHDRKKQKHFGLFTFLSLCTNTLVIVSLTLNWSAYISHMQQHSSLHFPHFAKGISIQLLSTNYWVCCSKATIFTKS